MLCTWSSWLFRRTEVNCTLERWSSVQRSKWRGRREGDANACGLLLFRAVDLWHRNDTPRCTRRSHDCQQWIDPSRTITICITTSYAIKIYDKDLCSNYPVHIRSSTHVHHQHNVFVSLYNSKFTLVAAPSLAKSSPTSRCLPASWCVHQSHVFCTSPCPLPYRNLWGRQLWTVVMISSWDSLWRHNRCHREGRCRWSTDWNHDRLPPVWMSSTTRIHRTHL